jgi:hypothetical protein
VLAVTRRLAAEALGVALVVLLLHVAFRLTTLFATGAFNDDGVYVALGQSLARGSGYRLIYLAGDPVAVKFPPGLPAVLAVAWLATGSLTGVRAVVSVLDPVFVAGAAGLLWWLGRRRFAATPLPLAVLAIGPLVLDPVIQYSNLALAEPEFLLGWGAVLVLALPLINDDAPRRGVARAAALGAVLAAATLFRSVGFALIVAVLGACVLRRRWRTLWVTAAAALVPLVAWQVVHARLIARGPVAQLPDEVGYWQLLPFDAPIRLIGQLARSVWTHAYLYARSIGAYVLVPLPLGWTLVVAAGVAAVVGALRHRREAAVAGLSVAGTLAAALLWPFAQDRFVLFILPFAGLLAATEVDRWIARAPARLRRVGHAALIAVAVAVAWRQGALRRAAGEAFVTGQPPASRDSSPAFSLASNSRFIYRVSEWVRTHTTSGDRLLVDGPPAVFLLTGRKTMQATPAESELAPSVFAVPGRYLAQHVRHDSLTVVVVGSPGSGLERDVRAVAERCPGVLAPADGLPMNAPGFPRYYRVAPDGSCLDSLLGMRPAKARLPRASASRARSAPSCRPACSAPRQLLSPWPRIRPSGSAYR